MSLEKTLNDLAKKWEKLSDKEKAMGLVWTAITISVVAMAAAIAILMKPKKGKK